MRSWEADTVQAFGALHSLLFKKKLLVINPPETHVLNNEEKHNGLRIMLRAKPLGQGIELKMQRRRIVRRRNRLRQLKTRDRVPEYSKQHFTR
jgi:hypothetical protein